MVQADRLKCTFLPTYNSWDLLSGLKCAGMGQCWSLWPVSFPLWCRNHWVDSWCTLNSLCMDCDRQYLFRAWQNNSTYCKLTCNLSCNGSTNIWPLLNFSIKWNGQVNFGSKVAGTELNGFKMAYISFNVSLVFIQWLNEYNWIHLN